mmetsp:Transcript_25582/g.64909  ORF Transcript_25582/g.64909 Transcript_25582/m.64909 type:complete len:547 (-) Transcript_25582:409-2049(-)
MDEESIQEPLLQRSPTGPRDSTYGSEVTEENIKSPVGVPGGVVNLCKCIVGAGLLAIPRAFSLLGAGLSTIMMAFVGLMTVLTINEGLVMPSTHGASGSLWLPSYAELVHYWVGERTEWMLSFLMAVGSLGFMSSYMDIIIDILLGSGSNPGLITGPISHLCGCDVFGASHHTMSVAAGSQAAGAGATSDARLLVASQWAWLLDRRIVLAGVVLFVLTPLCLRRSMGSLGAVAAVGLVSLAAFLVSIAWLALAAVRAGVAHPLPWGIDTDALGGESWCGLFRAFSVISVLLTADGCHQNIHPLAAIVHPYSAKSMRRVVVISLAICSTYYWLVSVLCWMVFGPDIEDDILTNLSTAAMAPLVGHAWALAISYAVRTGYLLSIVGSAVLTMFPLRTALADLVHPWVPLSWRNGVDDKSTLFVPLSLGILLFAYVLAVAVPSIWVVISLVGSVSATFIGYGCPAAILWSYRSSHSFSDTVCRVFAVFTGILGFLIFVNGFVTLYMKAAQPAEGGAGSGEGLWGMAGSSGVLSHTMYSWLMPGAASSQG